MATTAVRVALRVRPLTENEKYANATECISFIPNEPQILIGKDHSFTYDHVFDPQCTQQTIYTSSVLPLLDKFVDGFNATILAYGQTGSGKTYSMGTALDEHLHSEQQGIVPRFILDLFQRLQAKQVLDYQVHASFLELYNEDFIDLLNTQTDRRRLNPCDINIRENVSGNIYWTGVREELCTSPQDLLSILTKGSLCRTTGATDMNAVSSRSHAIFTVTLKQTVPDHGDPHDPPLADNTLSDHVAPVIDTTTSKKTLTSKFHFVDLAGSERLKRTNAQGDRAREGIAINSGLLALGNVISALGDESRKASHVPYRDSKLTRLLQDSLGGNSQTLMMACVSPAEANFAETLSTLKYANRAKNIRNKVSINQEFAGSSMQANQLRAQLSRLRMELQSLKASQTNTLPLQQEILRLRQRLSLFSDQLYQAHAQRDTLLMERDLANQMDAPKLWEQLNWLMNHDDDNDNSPLVPDQDNPSSYTPAVQRILDYQHTIQQLRDELADTKDRLAFMETAAQTSLSNSASALILPGFQPLHPHNSSTTSSIRSNKPLPRRLASTAANKKKRVRFNPSSSVRTTSSVTATATLRSSAPVTQSVSTLPPIQPSALSTNDYHDIHQWLKDTVTPMDSKSSNVSDLRNQVRHSISKARSEIERGLQVLQDIKPEQETADNYDLLNDDELFKQLQSEESNLYLGDLDDWHDSCQRSESSSSSSILHGQSFVTSCEHRRTFSNDTTVSAQTNLSALDQHPQWSRMIQQIQSDIQVKEELVSQLERSEAEYLNLRKQYEDKLSTLCHEILQLKQKCDAASQQQSQGMQRRPSQDRDVRAMYDGKLKHLLNQLSEVRRKYAQTTHAIQATRNQNESTLRALRVNVASLNEERRRMIKRMRDEANRVREQTMNHERELQQMRRKHSRHIEAKRQLEREARQLHRQLQKRTDDNTMARQQLKQVTSLVRKAVSNGGVLDERLLARSDTVLRLGPIRSSSTAPARSALPHQRRHPQRHPKTGDPTLPLAMRITKKKQLLDQALIHHLHGKQVLMELQALVAKRDSLVREKVDLIAQKEEYQQQQDHASTVALDAAVQQCMDERLDTLVAEINYLDARMYDVQQQQVLDASTFTDDAIQPHHEPSSSTRHEKRVSFADQVLAEKKTMAWADTLNDQFGVRPGTDPDMAHAVALRLLASCEPDEGYKMMESLVTDMIGLRMNDYHQHHTIVQLKQTVDELQANLLAMKQAAIATSTQHERKIRALEQHQQHLLLGARNPHLQPHNHQRRLSISSVHSTASTYSTLSSSAASIVSSIASSNVSSSMMAPPLPPPRRISLAAAEDDEVDSAIDLHGDLAHDQPNDMVIFDKIYEQGMRAASNAAACVQATTSMDQRFSSAAPTSDQLKRHSLPPILDGPSKPSVSPLSRQRDQVTSPEEFLHRMLHQPLHPSPCDEPWPSTQPSRRSSWAPSSQHLHVPASSSTLLRAHLQREDRVRQRDSPTPTPTSTSQQQPRKRPTSLVLAPLAKNWYGPGASTLPSDPGPLPSPRASLQHPSRAASMSLRPGKSPVTPPTTPAIFNRLSNAHTQASHAKRSESALGFHRHSVTSLEDLQQRWPAAPSS